jgi:two-component system NtrC family sensor kinase
VVTATLPRRSKRTVGALRVLLGAAVLVPVLLVAVAGWQHYRVLVEEGEQRTLRTATILQQHTVSSLELYDLVFRRVADHLAASPRWPAHDALQPFLVALDRDLGNVQSVYVVDATGAMYAHSRFTENPRSNAGDRDYFIALRDRGERTYIGAPDVGRLSRQPRISISHRLAHADGRFAGAVVVSIPVGFFTNFHNTLREDAGDVVNLVRDDGVILTRSPPAPGGDTEYRPGAFRPLLTPDFQGVYHKFSTLDGTERIYAFRRVPGYPLFVTFGLEMGGVLQDWITQVLTYAGIAAPAMLLLILATWIALRRARQEEVAYAQLETEIAQRTAAEAKREEAETALRQAQKMEALGQLTGGIAHDFNNLLTVIAGNIDLALRKVDDPAALRRLRAGLTATERGQHLTQQLLAFARRRPLRSVVVALPERLAELAAFVGQTMGSTISIKEELPADLWLVQVDDEQLQVAILNLIVNARDAMPAGGEIRITARNLRLPSPERALVGLAGEFVALSVSDHGDGIEPDVLPRVFEPFFTTKSVGRGSGLGLSQVYSFAKQSNGLAEIDSTVGRGTTVTLYLPRSTAPLPVRSAAPAALPDPAGPARRVLIVEDDPEVAEVARGYLEELGFTTDVVDRGVRALETLANDTRFDLVFSDVVMPDGMSGVDLARHLNRLYPTLPVLLTTGYAGEHRETALDVLRKPYTARTLREAVERALSAERPAAAAAPVP